MLTSSRMEHILESLEVTQPSLHSHLSLSHKSLRPSMFHSIVYQMTLIIFTYIFARALGDPQMEDRSAKQYITSLNSKHILFSLAKDKGIDRGFFKVMIHFTLYEVSSITALHSPILVYSLFYKLQEKTVCLFYFLKTFPTNYSNKFIFKIKILRGI